MTEIIDTLEDLSHQVSLGTIVGVKVILFDGKEKKVSVLYFNALLQMLGIT